MASDNGNDDLVIGARIDQLTRTVAELVERFERQEHAVGDRVDGVARRVSEAAERLEAGLAETDATMALRLEQATTSVRARVEQVLAELSEHLLADRVAGEDLIAGRAAGLESGVAELSELLPELRAMTASVSSTVTALAVSTSGLARYVQEVMSSAEAVGPKVDAALVAVEERMFERSDRDDASLRARLDQAAGSLESFGSQIESVVERAVHRSVEGTAGEVVGQVAGTLEVALSRLTTGQVDELASLGDGLTQELMRLTQVQGAEIAKMRNDVTDEVAKLRIEAAAHTGGLTNGLTAALDELQNRFEQTMGTMSIELAQSVSGASAQAATNMEALQSRGAQHAEQMGAALLAEVQGMRAAAKEANDGLTEATETLGTRGLETHAAVRAGVDGMREQLLEELRAGLAAQSALSGAGAAELHEIVGSLLDQIAKSQQSQQSALAGQLQELVGHGHALSSQMARLDDHSTELEEHRETLGQIGGQLATAIAAAGDAQFVRLSASTEEQRSVVLALVEQVRDRMVETVTGSLGELKVGVDAEVAAASTARQELRVMVLEQISELRDQVSAQGASTKVVADETLRDITVGLAQMEAAASDGAVAALDARAELFASVAASVAASQEAAAAVVTSRSEVMAQTVLDQLDRLRGMLATEQAAAVTAVASERETMQEAIHGLHDELRATLASLDLEMRTNIVGERADVTNVLRELESSVTTSLSDEQSRIAATLATMREDLAMFLGEERDSMAAVVRDGQQVFAGQQDRVRVLLTDGLGALTSTFQQEQQALGSDLRSALADETGALRSTLVTTADAIHSAAGRQAVATRELLEELTGRLQTRIDEDSIERRQISEDISASVAHAVASVRGVVDEDRVDRYAVVDMGTVALAAAGTEITGLVEASFVGHLREQASQAHNDAESMRALLTGAMHALLSQHMEDSNASLDEVLGAHIEQSSSSLIEQLEERTAQLAAVMFQQLEEATSGLGTRNEQAMAALLAQAHERVAAGIDSVLLDAGSVLGDRVEEFRLRLCDASAATADDLRLRTDAIAALLSETRISVGSEGAALREAAAELRQVAAAARDAADAADSGVATVGGAVARITEQAGLVGETAARMLQGVEMSSASHQGLLMSITSEVAELSGAHAGFQTLVGAVIRQVVDESDAVRRGVIERIDAEMIRGDEHTARMEAALSANVERNGDVAHKLLEQTAVHVGDTIDRSTKAVHEELLAQRKLIDAQGSALAELALDMRAREAPTPVSPMPVPAVPIEVVIDPEPARVTELVVPIVPPTSTATRTATRTVTRKDGRGALRVKLVKLGSVDRGTQNALVEHYGSVRALRAAPVSDVASVAGVSSDVAAAIQKDVD